MKGYSLVILLALALSCALVHPSIGAACNEGDEVCQPGGKVLVCRQGAYQVTHCGGPAGCSMAPDRTVTCDQTVGAVAGEACLAHFAGSGQCTSGSSWLLCQGGLWSPQTCSAGKSCSQAAGSVVCE